jgi:argininosuccinate lyase
MATAAGKSSEKAWGGRFSVSPDERSEAFTASIGFDVRMVKQDIRGSVAHARMLARQGIIPADDAAKIEEGLWLIWDEAEAGTLSFTVKDEDVHTGVERRLRELIGAPQARLHTARSRNDQVATDTRLWSKGALLELLNRVVDLADALLTVAAEHFETVMPGYTHTQRAQPVVVAHHLLAYVSMLQRDADRIMDAYRRVDRMPLGSGALAGVTYPIDRASVAADLGFAEVIPNSMDAISDRDFVLDTIYACSTIAIHLSRLCEELVMWSSGEFKFIELSDAYSTGSSIMPQKKNADFAELSRGKTGRVIGHLTGTLMMLKGLPLTFNSDMQEDKEALFDAVDTVIGVLGVVPGAVRTLTFRKDRLAEAAVADFILATDAADLLARNGVAFREAHEVIGLLVRRCIERGKTFADLTDAEWAEAHPIFADKRPPLTALESVNARDMTGGTAVRQVKLAHADAVAKVSQLRDWQQSRQAALDGVMRRNSRGPGG